MQNTPANRVAVYLTGLGNLVAGVAPFAFGFLDNAAESVAYTSAILGMNGIVIQWLHNWGKWEERTDLEGVVKEQIAGSIKAEAKKPSA